MSFVLLVGVVFYIVVGFIIFWEAEYKIRYRDEDMQQAWMIIVACLWPLPATGQMYLFCKRIVRRVHWMVTIFPKCLSKILRGEA